MAFVFLVSPMNNGLAFKISEGQKGGKGGWPWPQDSLHVSLPGRRNLSCWDGGVLGEDSVVSGLGNELVCDINKRDNTEGSEEESIYGKVTRTDPERWNLKYLWANMVEIWEAVRRGWIRQRCQVSTGSEPQDRTWIQPRRRWRQNQSAKI